MDFDPDWIKYILSTGAFGAAYKLMGLYGKAKVDAVTGLSTLVTQLQNEITRLNNKIASLYSIIEKLKDEQREHNKPDNRSE